MRRYLPAILLVVVVAAVVGGVVWRRHNTPQARRARLVARFLAAAPDSLDPDRLAEIRGLFDTFWKRAAAGEVAPKDVRTVDRKLDEYGRRALVPVDTLVHFMAEVGYLSYKKDPRYNLPGGEVDHPTLNPEAGKIEVFPDTSGFGKWYARRQRLEAERKKSDSLGAGSGARPDSTR